MRRDGSSAAEPQDACGQYCHAGLHRTENRLGATGEPEIFSKIGKVLLPKAYVRLLLTGELAEDMSDAAGSLWLDVGKRDWSDELLAVTGLNRSHMPRLVEGSAVSGTSSRNPPPLGHRAGCGGGGRRGRQCGRSLRHRRDPAGRRLRVARHLWRAVRLDARFSPNTEGAVHAFCHAIPDTWHQMGVILSATDSINWLSRITGQSQAALSQAAEAQFTRTGRGDLSALSR